MRATWLFIGSAFIITAAGYGCDSNGETGSGGESTSTSTSSGGPSSSSASGMGGGMPCMAPSDCPGQDNICGQRTCDSGFCGVKITLKNAPTPSQVYGDCKTAMCDDK